MTAEFYHSELNNDKQSLLDSRTERNADSINSALHSQWDLICDGLLQGVSARGQQAQAEPLLTGLEITSSFGLVAGLGRAFEAGGRWKLAAEALAGAFSLATGSDLIRRGLFVHDAYASTDANSVQGQQTRKDAIAQYVGRGLVDYSLMIASGGLGAAALHLRPSLGSSVEPLTKPAEINSSRASDRISEIQNSKINDHVKLNFEVDPTLLAYHTLTSTRAWVKEVDPSVVNFQNRAWQRDQTSYKYLLDHDLEGAIVNKMPRAGSVSSDNAWKLLDHMQDDPSFQPILADTNKARAAVKDEWESNLNKTQDLMQNLTGLPLDKDISVFITHPSIRQGHANHGAVFWTNRADFPNYNTVYLWHEILHHEIEPRIVGAENYDVGHGVIELLTDNELRVQLNGGSMRPLQGHAYLSKGEEYLLPSWRNYVEKPGPKNISKYLDEAASLIEKMPTLVQAPRIFNQDSIQVHQ